MRLPFAGSLTATPPANPEPLTAYEHLTPNSAGSYQIWRQPLLDLFKLTPRRLAYDSDLVPANPADVEIPRQRMREVEAADAGRGCHRPVFGQRETLPFGVQQLGTASNLPL